MLKMPAEEAARSAQQTIASLPAAQRVELLQTTLRDESVQAEIAQQPFAVRQEITRGLWRQGAPERSEPERKQPNGSMAETTEVLHQIGLKVDNLAGWLRTNMIRALLS